MLTYGLENFVLNKIQIRKIQTTKGTIIKKMMNLKKSSRTTDLLLAMGLEKIECALIKRKLGFIQRMRSNSKTDEILKEIETNECKIDQMSKKSIIREVIEYLDYNEFDYNEINIALTSRIKELYKINSNGISDSIKICLENMDNPDYRKILEELVKSY